MKPMTLMHDLINLLDLLQLSEVALLTTTVTPYGPNRNKRITWAQNSYDANALFRNRSATVSEYWEWLESGNYSAVLFDGSILQISYDFRFAELTGHRLLYFPCPFDVARELGADIPVLQVLEPLVLDRLDGIRLRAPIRFDYDRRSARPGHPASHMTFQWSHVRVPVMSPLSLGHFVEFVFRNFYPDIWDIHKFLRDYRPMENPRTITTAERTSLHVNAFAANNLER